MRRRRRLRRFVVLVLALALVAYLAWLVGASRTFGVRQIEVEGVSLVSSDDVIAVAGVSVGQPLVRLSQARINANVTGNLLEVQSVKVSRYLSGTVVLHVTERTPVYQVAVNDQYGQVSADGTVFHLGAKVPGLMTCQVVIGDSNLLADIATVVLALPPELAPHVEYLAASSQDSISLQLDAGRQVIWGSAEQSDLKASILVTLLNVPGTVYDVSAPASPTVR